MVPAVFVIDDFLRNAEEVRRQALALDYMIGGRYPGLNSKQKLRIEGLDEIVSMLVREPVRAPWTNDFSHGSCRIALASDEQQARIHIDQSHWSGILYLSRPEDCQGGTEFFRHKRTNTDRVPMDTESLKAIGYSSSDIPALVEGTLPQHRVTKLSPRPAGPEELARLFEDAMVAF